MNAWTSSAFESEVEQWQGEPVHHWGAPPQFAVVEPQRAGRGISADVAACETPLQHQGFSPWEEKSCSFLSLITETACSWVHDTRLVLVSWSVLYAKEIIGSKSNKSHECIPCVMVSVKSWAQQSHFTLSHCLFELCGWHIFCHILNVFLNHKKSYLSFFLPQSTLKNELKHSRLSCPLLCESAENSLGLLPICWVRNWRKFFIAHKAYV